MTADLTAAAAHLIRDCGKPIRTFSGASIRGHAIWIATYHGQHTECKTFKGEERYNKLLEAFANLWGDSLEYPYPHPERVRCKVAELDLQGVKVITSIKVLDGSGYFVAVRFPDEVASWRARQIVSELGPDLIKRAENTYNTNHKRK